MFISGLPSLKAKLETSSAQLFELVRVCQRYSHQGYWIVNHLSTSEHQKFMILMNSDTAYDLHKLR